jgi:hypothetical protein
MPEQEHWRTEEASQIDGQTLGIRDALRRLDDSLAYYHRNDYRAAGLVLELEQALGVKFSGDYYSTNYLIRFEQCIVKVRALTGLPVLAKVQEDKDV